MSLELKSKNNNVNVNLSNNENQLLYFMIMKDTLPILEINFMTEGGAYDPVLVSGFISALNSFAVNLNQNEVKVIDQGDIKIALEKGNQVSIIYMVKSVTTSIRKKIQTTMGVFESKYEILLKDSIFDVSLCQDFQEYVIQNFAVETIKPYYIPKFTISTQEFSEKTNKLVPLDIIPILSKIDGKRTITKITKSLGQDSNLILEHISWLRSQNIIEFEVRIDPFDFPILTQRGSKTLITTSIEHHDITSKFGIEAINIIKNINGEKSIQETINQLSSNPTKGLSIFKMLFMKNYIHFIPEKMKTVLFIEQLHLFLEQRSNKLFGTKGDQFLKIVLEESKNPYINLVGFDTNGKLSFKSLKTHLSGQDTITSNQLLEAFLPSINLIFEHFNNKLGAKYTETIKNSLAQEMRAKFDSVYLELLP